ncbi:MAG TPA: hypothetical protein VNT52_04375 [Acidimicrobiales bacterium]|nr:hypothetical protein [Acidimicrobiales bacterium]
MRARTIAALIIVGVALLVVGRSQGGGGDQGADRPARPQARVSATTTAAAATTTTAPTVRPTSRSSATSTVPSTAFVQGRQSTDRLEREQPLARSLPHTTSHYAIDYRVAADGSLELTVRLFAVLNNADQLAQYEDQLRTYKAEALGFIRAQGEDPGRYRITYEPPEAAAL